MIVRIVLMTLLVCSGLGVTAVESAGELTIHDLGIIVYRVRGINEDGHVVGYTGPSSPVSGFVYYDETRGMVALPGLPDAPDYENYACGINDLGNAVGYCCSLFGRWLACRWDTTGPPTVLDTTNGSWAYAINNSGVAVGRSEIAGVSYPWKWEADGTPVDLSPETNPRYGQVNAINESGRAAGKLGGKACAWEPTGSVTPLPQSGATDSEAYSINDAGWIAGKMRVGYNDYACVWNPENVLTPLGVLPDHISSMAYGINNSCQVVGQCYRADYTSTAFVWDSANGMRALSHLPGKTWSVARCINDRGQIAGESGNNAVLWCPDIGTCSIGGCRQLPQYMGVEVKNAVVTAADMETNCSFIESPDRSAGIKLLTAEALAVGQQIDLQGYVGRVQGEYQITAAAITGIRNGTVPRALLLTTKAIGSDRTETLDYTEVNTTGLLVTVIGKVTAVISSESVFYLDDGAGYQDGLGPFVGLRIHVPPAVPTPAKGRRLAVTGISRVKKHTLTAWGEVNGDWYPAGTVVYVPSIWARDANDIQVL